MNPSEQHCRDERITNVTLDQVQTDSITKTLGTDGVDQAAVP